ncbi:methanethiol S-methyltransferase [Salinisphaera hydrothermalis]|uniref:methanethiol S-methyltransferase n=1 Tax=Salinisphaera hydrothermalis (strain C41B8) TaxID=1304275 RepID=A0A084IHG0_SALHC|nr:methanethiol S-methyltransferase [Salinisphaera hydrothermalis]KEZ76144.1 hypothetical protein C41B8_16449 [Salinisphaera hydrothermalis C41B8]
MQRGITIAYGGFCYLLFLLTFLYAIAFFADFGVPRTIDRGPAVPAITALAVDIALLGLFAIQHSGMARSGFKHWLCRYLSAPLERSTYVLLSSLVLLLLFWQWKPLPGVIWSLQSPVVVALLYAIAALGWLIVLTSTFAINHFDLFGLRQVWLSAHGKPYKPVAFQEHFYYRLVRHPLMLGFIIAFWATPTMTVGHLLFAVISTAYMLLAIHFLEEPDLVAAHGEAYRDYQRRVPMICPRLGAGRSAHGRRHGST